MKAQTVEDIGRRVIAFLEQALPGREPERDILLAQAILADLLALLPEQDPGWSEGIERAAAVVADWLASRPEQWREAIRLVAVYLRSARVEVDSGHARVDLSHTMTQQGKQRRHVHVHLATPMTRTIVTAASREERLSLFSQIDDWEVIQSLADALPPIKLADVEMATLLYHIDSFTRGDGARGLIYKRVFEWAEHHDHVARTIVDRWIARDTAIPQLDPASLATLVEGIVAGHPDLITWRDEIVARLNRRNNTDAWKLAVSIVGGAWPAGTPIEKRYAALLELIRDSPEMLVEPALETIWRDAVEYPAETVQCALDVLALWPVDNTEARIPGHLAVAIAERAAWSLNTNRDTSERNSQGLGERIADAKLINWSAVLDVAITVPPNFARSLDGLLKDLHELANDLLYPFFVRWLTEYGGVLAAQRIDLERIFPLFTRKLGPAVVSRWLTGLTVAANPKLRAAVIMLLRRSNGLSVTVESLEGLDDVQAMACMHQLIGAGAPGDEWIWTLFRLGHARPQLLEVVATILIDDAVPTYPGKCRRALDALWGPQRTRVHDTTVEEAIDKARERIGDRLAENRALREQTLAIPEIVTTRPCAARWREASEQAMQASWERERRSGRFPLLAMMPQVPIARGDASIHRGSDEPIRFAEISRSFELPLRDLIDPVAAELARRAHLADADALLSSLHPADDDESAT